MNLLDLTPPYSIEAEQGVLDGLMLDNLALELIADVLSLWRERPLGSKLVSVHGLPLATGRRRCVCRQGSAAGSGSCL